MADDKENIVDDTEVKVEEKNDKKDKKKAKAPKSAELLAKIADLESKILYLQADYQNYRKRTSKDINDARVSGTANALEPFLRVNDFLGMAQIAVEKSDNIEAIKQGILMIINEYTKAMDELGVVRIKSINEKFNPELHDAISQEFSETVADGVIIKEVTGGYKMGERLLRPARVIVSKGKEVAADDNSDAVDVNGSSSENFSE
ncbi:MAG: nucleotide exchange factor GrpE [Lentisphaeria bacterium]|nr:nucleotide exchange factor GrpE [Lentisphaeria bacterium]